MQSGSMSTSELSNLAPLPVAPSPVPPDRDPGRGWLGSSSVFDQQPKRKMSTAMAVSLAFHAGIVP